MAFYSGDAKPDVSSSERNIWYIKKRDYRKWLKNFYNAIPIGRKEKQYLALLWIITLILSAGALFGIYKNNFEFSGTFIILVIGFGVEILQPAALKYDITRNEKLGYLKTVSFLLGQPEVGIADDEVGFLFFSDDDHFNGHIVKLKNITKIERFWLQNLLVIYGKGENIRTDLMTEEELSKEEILGGGTDIDKIIVPLCFKHADEFVAILRGYGLEITESNEYMVFGEGRN